jgi:hypothetical protein
MSSNAAQSKAKAKKDFYKPTKADKLDVSGVTFTQDKKKPTQIYMNDGNHSIFLQTPELDVRWDTGDFIPNEKSTESGKYKVQTHLTGHDVEGSKVKVFCDKMVELDEAIMKAAQENSVAWFKKKNMSRDTVESIYYPIVKMVVDRDTGEVDQSRAPSFTFKISQYDGDAKCKIFDGDKNEININHTERSAWIASAPNDDEKVAREATDMPDRKTVGIVRPFEERLTIAHEGLFKKNSKVKVVMRCKGIWNIGGKFGCTWQAEQVGLKVAPSFEDYAFLDSDEDETGDTIAPGNYVDSSSEEEDDEGQDLTRTTTKKA